MKDLKRFIVCLLSLAILCSSPATLNVRAAETIVEDARTVASTPINILCTKNGVSVRFYFVYSDGNSATLVAVLCETSGYIISAPSTHFDNDTRYASVIATNEYTGAQITLGAWCDIYGQMGTF